MTKLIDSDTNETVTASDLGITDAEYAELLEASRAPEAGDTGHVRTSTGRRAYAQMASSIASTLSNLDSADATARASAIESSCEENWEMGTRTWTFADGSRLQVFGEFVKELNFDE